jgi:hypothetical protein
MEKHTCKHCNRIFEYCRGCLLSPIPHKDAGYCSKECYEASKNATVKPEPIVEEVITEEPIVEINNEVSIEDVQPTEEIIPVEVLNDVEIPTETTEVVEPIKNETNTYKKKKNKYKYTSSY